MIKLLSKIKDECHKQDIDLMHSEINGDAIKLACTINGRRDTELNAYIVPDGDNYGIYTVTPQGAKSETKCVIENEIIPELVASLTGVEPEKVIKEDENGGVDQVTIEVEDGVFDTKEVAHNTYKNSRYAYSDKYHKMGTIVEIRQLNSVPNGPSGMEVDNLSKAAANETIRNAMQLFSKYGMGDLIKVKSGVTQTDLVGFNISAEVGSTGCIVFTFYPHDYKTLLKAIQSKYPGVEYGSKVVMRPVDNKKLSAVLEFTNFKKKPMEEISIDLGNFSYSNPTQLETDLINKLCEVFKISQLN